MVPDVKVDGPSLDEKLAFKMQVLYFFSKLDWGSYAASIAKTV